jgi:hypothetical protein
MEARLPGRYQRKWIAKHRQDSAVVNAVTALKVANRDRVIATTALLGPRLRAKYDFASQRQCGGQRRSQSRKS